MQEHYPSHQQDQLHLSSVNLKNTSDSGRKREVTQYAPSFDLTTLNGNNGFVIEGLALGGSFGASPSVSTAGDLNGDGKADLVVGAPYASPGGRTDAGTVYVIFGRSGAWGGRFNLMTMTLSGMNGFRIEGLSPGDQLGASVSTAGDFNGDGRADLVVGANGADPGGRLGAGAAYVIFGPSSSWLEKFDLASLNGNNGFVIEGLSLGDNLGISVSTAGDLNGDSRADLVVGADNVDLDSGGRPGAGAAYVIFGQASGWREKFDLASLNGDNGFVIEGPAVGNPLGGNHLGYSVDTAGDLNSDGRADLVVGAPYSDVAGRGRIIGTAYVIFGQASGWREKFDLASLNGNNGFRIEGLAAYDHLGISVSAAGDINGDGRADLVVGADAADAGGWTSAGAAYVIFGRSGAWEEGSRFDLTTLNGDNGFMIQGVAAGGFGNSVSTAGDLNNDGKADLVVGAYGADPGGRNNAGIAYVIFGRSGRWPTKFSLTTLDGRNGFVIEGLAATDFLGWSVGTVGDLNGDGESDLIVGASGAGTAYVIFGVNAFDLTKLNGINGFVIEGLAVGDQLGNSLSTAGDLNDDGISDLVVGAYLADPGGRSVAGTAYVIFGRSGDWEGRFDLTKLDGPNGFRIEGLAAYDWLGRSVGTAGDINGDGISDLIVGAYGADPGGRGGAGTAYVIFGRSSGWLDRFYLTTLDGRNGFVIEGLAVGDQLGQSVSTVGDINGDRISDLMVGAYLAAPGGRIAAGTAYVIFGRSVWERRFDLTKLDGRNGFRIEGLSAGDNLGMSVSTAGDLNNDGRADLVVGAHYADPGGRNNAGIAYVIFGRASWLDRLYLTGLKGDTGFRIEGLAADDNLGRSVNTVGDINGDGISDLMVGAYRADPGGRSSAGTAYVIFGRASGWQEKFDLTTLNSLNGFGFVIEGLAANDYLGISVSAAGDFNDDGISDLMVGAYGTDPGGRSSAGTTYVIFGRASGWLNKFVLTTLNGINGFMIEGVAAGDNLGISVSTAGDLNGDGASDLVLGAHDADPGGRSSAGTAYVLFGLPAAPLFPSPKAIPLSVNNQLTKLNRAPKVINPMPDQTIHVDQPFNFEVPSDTFVDPDGDPLVYSATQADDTPLPSWMSFDAQTRSFSGTALSVGLNQFGLFAKDPQSLSARSNFSLSVTAKESGSDFPLVGMIGAAIGGGVLCLGALIGIGRGIYKYAYNASRGAGKDEVGVTTIPASLTDEGGKTNAPS